MCDLLVYPDQNTYIHLLSQQEIPVVPILVALTGWFCNTCWDRTSKTLGSDAMIFDR
jgi:hypothetical protein